MDFLSTIRNSMVTDLESYQNNFRVYQQQEKQSVFVKSKFYQCFLTQFRREQLTPGTTLVIAIVFAAINIMV